jgi:acyl-CoA synthetase (AMP-forming)/AMP-acid ligase II
MAGALTMGTSWWDLICRRATMTPDGVFLSDDAGRSLTFREFCDTARNTAAALHDDGIVRESVVSWQLPSTLEAAVVMAALSCLGVRQNPILPILRHAEISHITRQLGTDVLIVPGTYRGTDLVTVAKESAPPSCRIIDASQWPLVDTLRLPGRNDLPSEASEASEAAAVAADGNGSDRWVFYSSGTTSVPKGVRHSDASAMASSIAQVELIKARSCEVFPVAFPISHIGGIMVLTAYLRVGAHIVLLDGFDPSTTPQVMAAAGATVLGSATPFFNAYLAAQRDQTTPLFPHLHQLQAGGAPISPELNAECVQVFGVPIINQWGLTEFPSATSLGDGDPPHQFAVSSVGRMIPGAQLKILSPEGQPTALGVEGELWVNGPQRFLGYVDASLDDGAFDTDGYFRTGDLGRIDNEGFVHITGRLKDVIIRNAENISAQEVENVLVRHSSIADVAVIGVPDNRTGERACAVVVLRFGASPLTVTDLAAHCIDHGLARYKIPEQIHHIDALPRTPMGKVLKQDLRKQFA